MVNMEIKDKISYIQPTLDTSIENAARGYSPVERSQVTWKIAHVMN